MNCECCFTVTLVLKFNIWWRPIISNFSAWLYLYYLLKESSLFSRLVIYLTNHIFSLVHFSFEDHKAMFPITIRRPSVPVLYDPGNGKSTTYKVKHTTKQYATMASDVLVVTNVYINVYKVANKPMKCQTYFSLSHTIQILTHR